MATDESVIKKRLLIEGDGGGDDKRISTLLKVRFNARKRLCAPCFTIVAQWVESLCNFF